MHEEKFIKKNIDTWKKLEDYNKNRKAPGKLSKRQLAEYEYLMRVTGYHLSYAKTFYPESRAVDYLNRIMGDGDIKFYVRERFSVKSIPDYFREVPGRFKAVKIYFYISMGLFFLGFLFSLILGIYDPSLTEYFFGGLTGIGEGMGDETWYYPILSAYIMTNNVRVCITAYVFGIFFGIGTAVILILNGIIIGALYSQVITQGMSQLAFWSLILPHGFIELTAIFLSGGLGLLMGKSLLFPGRQYRKNSLIIGAKQGIYFIPVIAVMLVTAGLIEGFFTPLSISGWIKLGFSAITLFLVILYLSPGSSGQDRSQSNH